MPSNASPQPPANLGPAEIQAFESFRASRPWQGTRDQRLHKRRLLVRDLFDAWSSHLPITPPSVVAGASDEYRAEDNEVVLKRTTLSVLSTISLARYALHALRFHRQAPGLQPRLEQLEALSREANSYTESAFAFFFPKSHAALRGRQGPAVEGQAPLTYQGMKALAERVTIGFPFADWKPRLCILVPDLSESPALAPFSPPVLRLVCEDAPDSNGGGRKRLTFERLLPFPHNITESQLLAELRESLRIFACHEADEAFLLDGRRVFDPHR